MLGRPSRTEAPLFGVRPAWGKERSLPGAGRGALQGAPAGKALALSPGEEQVPSRMPSGLTEGAVPG